MLRLFLGSTLALQTMGMADNPSSPNASTEKPTAAATTDQKSQQSRAQEPLALDGSTPFETTEFYPKLMPGQRTWQDIEFKIGKNFLMATPASELVIPVGRTKVERIYLLQCGRGNFVKGDRLGVVEFTYATGKPESVDLISGRNTQYPSKKTDTLAGPDGFHILEWVNPHPDRAVSSAVVRISSRARIHLMAATVKLGPTSARIESPAPRPKSAQAVTAPAREKSAMMNTAPIKQVPVALHASPTLPSSKDGIQFAVHRTPVEATQGAPQRGLNLGKSGITKIHFLQCGRRNLSENQQVGYYRMYYSDGSTEQFDLVTQRNIDYPDWADSSSKTPVGMPEGMDVASWVNPHPEKVLRSLDMVSTKGVTIQLWALTVELADDSKLNRQIKSQAKR